MSSSSFRSRDKITVTGKYLETQPDLEKETLFDFPSYPQTAKSTMTAGFRQTNRTNPEAFLTTYSSPKSGYFGPKTRKSSAESKLIGSQSAQRVYPNYLKRDPKEYPKIHSCQFKMEPEVKMIKPPKTVAYPKIEATIKNIHHTLFNSDQRKKIQKNPTVQKINGTIYPKGQNDFPIDLTMSRPPTQEEKERMAQADLGPGDSPEKEEMDDFHSNNNPMYSTLSKSIAWMTQRGWESTRNRKTMTSTRSSNFQNETKLAKIYERHQEREKEFEKTLITLNEKAKSKIGRFDRDLNEVPEFKQKMRLGQSVIDKMFEDRMNAKSRKEERVLKTQQNKYSEIWKHYKNDFEKKPKTPHRLLEIQVEEEGERKPPTFDFQAIFNKQTVGRALSGQQSNKNSVRSPRSMAGGSPRSAHYSLKGTILPSDTMKNMKDSQNEDLGTTRKKHTVASFGEVLEELAQ